MPTIIFVGGGSIGHIAPAVAIANALKKLMHEQSRASIQIYFICSTKEDDAKFLKKENFKYYQFSAPRLGISFPWKFFQAYKSAKKILNETKPNVIFSKGGYVSVPVCLAAKKMGIPIVLHESDAIMGRANKIIAKWAEYICMGFPLDTEKSLTFASEYSSLTGNPIRSNITQGNVEKGKHITGLTGEKPILLVMGGSQGSKSLNEFIINNIKELLSTFDIIHITGHGKKGSNPRKGYYSIEFAGDELAHFYAMADIAISRSGASAITELAMNNIPTVLVPLEGVAHNHQIANANAVKGKNFYLVKQININKELIQTTKDLLTNYQNPKTNCCYATHSSRQIAKIISNYLA